MPIIKEDLMAFEKEVARRWEAGEIKAPVHLGGGNESQLIEIFRNVKPVDWKLCTWRNHLHALLSGIPSDEIMRQILAGRSMFINSVEHRFYSSSIAGGILPVAVGLGMAIKRKGEDRKVWAFCGDMSARMGIFYECATYSKNFDLPIVFVIEDNFRSVQTNSKEVWGETANQTPAIWSLKNVQRYEYESVWPHSGTEVYVTF